MLILDFGITCFLYCSSLRWWFSQQCQQTKTLSRPQFLDHLLTGIECICGHYGHHHWKDKYDFLDFCLLPVAVFLWVNSICVFLNCLWAEGDWIWSCTNVAANAFVVQSDGKSSFPNWNPAVAVVTSPFSWLTWSPSKTDSYSVFPHLM